MVQRVKKLKFIQRASLFALVGLLSVGFMASIVPGKTASAMSPLRPNVCGAGYGLIGIYPIRVPSGTHSTKYGGPGATTGDIYLYWNNSAKKNCAVAWGAGRTSGVTLDRFIDIGTNLPYHFGPDDEDNGYYHSYAGPVYTKAQPSHTCVIVDAYIGPNGSAAHMDDYGRANYGPFHCG